MKRSILYGTMFLIGQIWYTIISAALSIATALALGACVFLLLSVVTR